MGKKILFAVMALLVMATGKIWAEGETAYAVLCPNEGGTTYSMHFVYTTATEKTVEGGEKEKTVDVTINGTTTSIKLTATNHWEITDDWSCGWQAPATSLEFSMFSKITRVVFEDSFKAVKVKKCNNWFEGFTSLAEIVGIENLNTSAVTYMNRMFEGCKALTSLDLSKFDTSSVTDMSYMFRKCSGLKSLVLSSFDTSQVTDMMYMFYGCSGLTTLDLSSFNTLKVTDMSYMFNGCSSLKSLNLSSFNTSKVGNMAKMFWECSSLTSLDLSSFNTSKVTDMNRMFCDCGSLTSLVLSSFNTSAVTNMECMFYGCKALTSLNLRSFNTSKVTNMMSMFNGCKNLSNLTLGSFDMTSVTSMYNMFYNCNNITIDGNALVFVTSDAQKNIWEGITGVNLMVKKDGTYKYEGDGTVDITLDNNEDTPVIFPYNFTANNVTFTRTFTKGKPHTICLPFAITNTADYGTFYKLSSYDKDNRRVKFTKVEGATVENTPYLFIPDKNKAGVTEIKVTGGVDISSTADETYTSNASNDSYTRFCGVYRKKTFTEQDLGGWYDYYGWTAEGDFRKAGAGASVAPCRAYIMLKKEATGSSAPARLSVEFDDGETTGISTAVSTANGGADAPMYNLQGQRVSGGYKGVVIKNGKKMIVK